MANWIVNFALLATYLQCTPNITQLLGTNFLFYSSLTAPPEPKGPGEDGRKSSFNYPFYVLFSFGIIFLAVVIGIFVFLFGKRRNKPNSGDVLQTHQPLLDGSNSNGNFGLSSITLKEIRAHGKFGSVWMVS